MSLIFQRSGLWQYLAQILVG